MITLFDNETILKGYIKEKENEAFAEGYAEGYAEGFAEGLAEADREYPIKIAKNMIYESMPIDLIAELSGLSVTEINAIKAKMVN